MPLLELSAGLPVETPATIWHRSIEAWWTMVDCHDDDPDLAAGLLTAYQGLDEQEPAALFWRRDAARELALTRTLLHRGLLAGVVQERLQALARRIPPTPEMEAEIGYALFLRGRTEAARQRLAVLTPAERTQPEIAFYEAAIRHGADGMPRASSGLPAGRELAGQKPR